MRIALLAALVALPACGPSRTTAVHYAGAPAAFDRAHADPKALEIADHALAAAGGPHWDGVKQIRWNETITNDGKPVLSFEEAWDRWNGRHYGRLHNASGPDVVVMRGLYEGPSGAYVKGQALSEPDNGKAVDEARKRFSFDTGMLLMPFLLEEPGTQLQYVGQAQGEVPADELLVTFPAADRSREGTWHVIVNRGTNTISRIELAHAGDPVGQRIGYTLTDYVDVGGLKLPGKLHNIGLASEQVAFDHVVVGEPDDSLYVPQVR